MYTNPRPDGTGATILVLIFILGLVFGFLHLLQNLVSFLP